jgi:hypothetical protein
MQENRERYAIWVPGLPGCWSQGKDETEALGVIRKRSRLSFPIFSQRLFLLFLSVLVLLPGQPILPVQSPYIGLGSPFQFLPDK